MQSVVQGNLSSEESSAENKSVASHFDFDWCQECFTWGKLWRNPTQLKEIKTFLVHYKWHSIALISTMSLMVTLLSYLKESKLSCRRTFPWHNITKTQLCDVSSALAAFVFSSRLPQLSIFVLKWHKDNISSRIRSRDRIFIIKTNLLLRQINQRNMR